MRRKLYPPILVLALVGWALSVPAQAQIAFRAASSAGMTPTAISFPVAAGTQVAVGANSSFTVAIPAGTQAGDFAVLIIAGRPIDTSEPAAPTTPGPWIFRSSRLVEVGTNDLKIMTFYRVLTSGDAGGLVTVSLPAGWNGTNRGMSGQIAVWRGVDTTTPFDVAADVTGSSAAAATWIPPSITTVSAGAWVVSAVATSDDNALGIPTANGFTGRMTGANYDTAAGGNHSVGLADVQQATAGTPTMLTWSQTVNGNDLWAGITFALRPATIISFTIPNPTVPAPTVQNDVMVASIGFRTNQPGLSTAVAITPPAGWTLVRRLDNPGPTDNGLVVYQKVAGASEPANYQWSFSCTLSCSTYGFQAAAGGIVSFSGGNTTTPIDTPTGEGGRNTTAALGDQKTPSGLSTTVANTMLVASHSYASAGSWVPTPGGPLGAMNEAVDVPAGNQTTAINWLLQPAAGAIGQYQATPTLEDDAGNAHILALRPFVCAAVADATYLSAKAQTGTTTITVRWSSSNPVTILRKTTAFITGPDNPSNGVDYIVTNPVGGATVVFKGTGGETTFSETGPAASTNETNRYYYKVFPRTGTGALTCYSPGADSVHASPPSASSSVSWGYMTGGGSILKPGIAGPGTIYSSGNAARIISLNTSDGTQNWEPVATADPNYGIQGWLTWVPAGGGKVKSVQSGTVTIPVGATALPQTVTVGAAQGFSGVSNLNKSVLFFTLRGSSVDPGDGQVRGRLVNTTTMEFYRANDTSLLDFTVQWYVVEFSGGVHVQRGTLTNVSSSSSVTLTTPVTLSRSFVLISCSVATGDATYGDDDFFRAQLTSSTNLEIVHGSSVTDKTCDWQVVQYAGASVQRNTGTLASGVTSTAPAIAITPSVDITKSFVQVTWTSDGAATTAGANFLRARLTDVVGNTASSITIERGATGSTLNYAWEVVTFTDGTEVLSGDLPFSATDPSLAASLTGFWPSGVDKSRAVAFLSGYQRGGSTPYATDDNVGPGWFTATPSGCTGNNCTTLTVERGMTGSVAANAAWIVIQFADTGATPAAARVIGADLTGRVYSVDPQLGVKNWEVTLTGANAVVAGVSVQVRDWSNTSLPCGDDVIFVASRNNAPDTTDNKVFALRASDGSVCWTFDKTTTGASNLDAISGQPWVDYARNLLYVTSRAGSAGGQKSLWVINSLNGAHIASFALGHINGSPTLSFNGNTLYVGTESGYIYALNLIPATPELKWTSPGPAYVLNEINGFVWEDTGRLYFTTKASTLNVWCLTDPGVGGGFPASPTVASACTGWTRATVAGALTPLLLNKLYVGGGGSDGKLHEINLTNGGQDAQCTVGNGTKPVGDVSSETGNEVFVGTDEGKIFKFTVPLPVACP